MPGLFASAAAAAVAGVAWCPQYPRSQMYTSSCRWIVATCRFHSFFAVNLHGQPNEANSQAKTAPSVACRPWGWAAILFGFALLGFGWALNFVFLALGAFLMKFVPQDGQLGDREWGERGGARGV